LTGTAIEQPSAYSIADRRPIRTDLSAGFDFAFDILPGTDEPVLLPRSALGFPSEGSLLPGLQRRDEAFAGITEGILDGYLTRDTIPVSDRKSTRLNSSHVKISYAVFCLKKKTR